MKKTVILNEQDVYDKIQKIFDDFLEVIETVGPNPYKDL